MAIIKQSPPHTKQEATKLSSKGQIVIPRAVRSGMDLHEGQTLYVEQISPTEIRLSTQSVVKRTAGSLKGLWGNDPMAWLKQERAGSDRF
jgi:AbrB family looped-hinge helix DNA binding protein